MNKSEELRRLADINLPDKVRSGLYMAARHIDELQSRLEQAEKDSAILEWMASRYLCADFRYGEPATEAIVIEIPRGSRVCGNLRQDIQAAMTKESAQ